MVVLEWIFETLETSRVGGGVEAMENFDAIYRYRHQGYFASEIGP